MPNQTSAILRLMRLHNIRPNQVLDREVINPDDDPHDWVNQGQSGWQPGQWVDGEQVIQIYQTIYAGLRERNAHLTADPGDIFRQAYQQACEQTQSPSPIVGHGPEKKHDYLDQHQPHAAQTQPDHTEVTPV